MWKKHCLSLALGFALIGSAAAAETADFIKEDFSGAIRCSKGSDAALKEFAKADGPTEGSKSIKLHFKIIRTGTGWPQIQYFAAKPFVPGKPFIVEFDMKCEHPGDFVGLGLEMVPFGQFQGTSRMPFLDDNGRWQKIRLRYVPRPGAEKKAVERLCFTANNSQQKVGDETIYYLANLRVYPEEAAK